MNRLLISAIFALAAAPAVHAQQQPSGSQTGSSADAPPAPVEPPWRRPPTPPPAETKKEATPASTARPQPMPVAAKLVPREEDPGILWYQPTQEDKRLPWNGNGSGRLDPWGLFEGHWVGFLLDYHSRNYSLSKSNNPDYSPSSSFVTLRIELSNLGLEVGTGSFGQGTTVSPNADMTRLGLTYCIGNYTIADIGIPDMQFGVLFPELGGSIAFGSFPSGSTGGSSSSFQLVSVGGTIIGGRATFLDTIKVDLRIGEVTYDVMTVPNSGSSSSTPYAGFHFGIDTINLRGGVVF